MAAAGTVSAGGDLEAIQYTDRCKCGELKFLVLVHLLINITAVPTS